MEEVEGTEEVNKEENETASVIGKRVRSSDSDKEYFSDLPDAEHLSKKCSLSDMETSSCMDVDRVALLDAGAQYGKVENYEISFYNVLALLMIMQVIDRRIRELNVQCIMLPLETSAASLKGKGFR